MWRRSSVNFVVIMLSLCGFGTLLFTAFPIPSTTSNITSQIDIVAPRGLHARHTSYLLPNAGVSGRCGKHGTYKDRSSLKLETTPACFSKQHQPSMATKKLGLFQTHFRKGIRHQDLHKHHVTRSWIGAYSLDDALRCGTSPGVGFYSRHAIVVFFLSFTSTLSPSSTDLTGRSIGVR
jgi:hypothetical protein